MDVYKPPESNLIIEKDKSERFDMFYVVSQKKFLILFIATLGLYEIYWFYKNWIQYKNFAKLSIWPIPRAIFAIFFVHSLFRSINTEGDKDKEEIWNHSVSATLYVIITLITFADQQIGKVLNPIISESFIFLSIFLMAWVFYIAQCKINEVCGSENGKENSSITGANIIWILIGIILWMFYILTIVETLYPSLKFSI